MLLKDKVKPVELFHSTRILTTEDSRIFRIWGPKRYQGRIMSKHNDIVTSLTRINDLTRKMHNTNLFLSASCDGAIKCYYGQRKLGTISGGTDDDGKVISSSN